MDWGEIRRRLGKCPLRGAGKEGGTRAVGPAWAKGLWQEAAQAAAAAERSPGVLGAVWEELVPGARPRGAP